ncbi:RAQPRD family integrative conjugative element protein [Pseudomonas sp. ER28]|uniref:integrative conjugative element protein, RAQPRD family n=1 Tax=Pseudomonas sp. ER28 TaxID=3033801 RepID=UPI0023DF4414|nr:RAQPRD family integrative conjugative element protein [Pseudomonas sp. ER28]MDF3172081.1 RAQPRD family integrative conjugative element protein [Pseudomonas sp. ER28]
MTIFSYPLLLAYLVSLSAAADIRERSDLELVQRQISSIEQLAHRASSSSIEAAGARYRFDYARFAADLERMHLGIHKYLFPSRAQPADMVELTDDYRAEASLLRPSDEHD